MMNVRTQYLGIDIGSIAIAVALVDENKEILHTSYIFHNGRIKENLFALLNEIDPAHLAGIGYTSSTPLLIKQGKTVDTRIAYITAARHFYPGLRALLIIGAEKFGLVTFDVNGEYRNYVSNSSCAAGTGNFLDQQAERLNIPDIKEFSKIAYASTGGFPKIASRCAVFAKTDLIHAQQEGYALGEICDGLSYGLAKNIVDAVFQNREFSTVVAAGGVALNKAVIKHIKDLTHLSVVVDEHAHVYGALGAALTCRGEGQPSDFQCKSFEAVITAAKKDRKYHYPPLQLKLSEYPDFRSHDQYEFRSGRFPFMKPVEIDLYSVPEKNSRTAVFLGIDIGSTSTKAVLLDHSKKVIAGFYTRTSGQPLQAVQQIFEAIRDLEEKNQIGFIISGAGTTGSGRKFTGKIIGADIIPDEITAHARAAFELDPETDTIIEIGGQDSKFTLMHDGMVTFSVMNNVCAAGTGSFIEEQAKRLGCSLPEYSQRAEKVYAPLASDRCSVFMERDLNHYLADGYSTDEILAAVLHSIRENYLTKVAVRGKIGKKIFFQGATAKNKALVAAFEQKLQKPIMVSKYCHLTGALGVALELHDSPLPVTKFRGLGLYEKTIPVRSEICELCTNHCKLKIAEIDGQIEAYGFLCGRDYQVKKMVRHKSVRFQLIRKREELVRFKAMAGFPDTKKTSITIGIPAGLHLFEEIPFWRKFFDLLSIRTITSEGYETAVKDGKNLCGAEFCAPIAAMHGHVNYLSEKADFVFLPVYLMESRETKMNRQYCYYTQYVTSVISVQKQIKSHEKLLTPLLKYSQGELNTRFELFKMLKSIGAKEFSFLRTTQAYEKAKKHMQSATEQLQKFYSEEVKTINDIHIVLLGRPYTVLSPAMNNHIPEIIEKNGIPTFFMDMLPYQPAEASRANELVKTLKWKFAARILYAAEATARTENGYPVLITSFKCTPDSFVIEYFKEILNSYKKPYLILQLDEHDSAVGYETRIESAIRAFRNHSSRQKEKGSIQQLPPHDFPYAVLTDVNHLRGKTLLLPSWDGYVGPLLEAVLQNSGIDARLLVSTNESMQRSLSYNTGQCLPLNMIVQDAIDYIGENRLNPSDTVLWMIKSKLSCNLSMFPYYMKKLLNDYGKGLEKTSVFMGDVMFYDFSLTTTINAYLAYMFGGTIRKIGCHIRPYERNKGSTDRVIGEALTMLHQVFLHGLPKEEVLEKINLAFKSIDTDRKERPKVAIFGDLYVRDNEMMNQHLIRTVEENGGEVITTPFSEYIKIIVGPHTERSLKEGRYQDYAKIWFLKSLIPLVEDKYGKYFEPFSGKQMTKPSCETDTWLNHFGLNILQRGESFENILKIHRLIQENPDLDLFIQTNPSYCCPSLVTEAMASKIEEITGVPVVTIEYDGTTGIKNEDIIPYLKYRKKKNNNN